jgi:transposase
MIPVPTGVRVWLATGHTDMRKGFGGLSLLVQETLKRDPHSGNLFVFRGRRGSRTTFSIPISIRQGRVPVASALRQELAGLPAL